MTDHRLVRAQIIERKGEKCLYIVRTNCLMHVQRNMQCVTHASQHFVREIDSRLILTQEGTPVHSRHCSRAKEATSAHAGAALPPLLDT